MYKVCTEAVHSVALWTRVTLGLDMCKVCTKAVHSLALWTRVTLGLDMRKVCTEAVHSVALWTRVTLGLDMCKVCTETVHSVAFWTRVTLGLDMCKVCTEAVHSVALWTCPGNLVSSMGERGGWRQHVCGELWASLRYLQIFNHGFFLLRTSICNFVDSAFFFQVRNFGKFFFANLT